MTTELKVDVIIPNYNQTKLLLRAVNSALDQGKIINKIIIIDDGSDAETIEFLNSNFFRIDKEKSIEKFKSLFGGIKKKIYEYNKIIKL